MNAPFSVLTIVVELIIDIAAVAAGFILPGALATLASTIPRLLLAIIAVALIFRGRVWAKWIIVAIDGITSITGLILLLYFALVDHSKMLMQDVLVVLPISVIFGLISISIAIAVRENAVADNKGDEIQ